MFGRITKPRHEDSSGHRHSRLLNFFTVTSLIPLIIVVQAVFGPSLSVKAVDQTGQFSLAGTVNGCPTPDVYDWACLFSSTGARLVAPDPVNGPLLADVFINSIGTANTTHNPSDKDNQDVGAWGCQPGPPNSKDYLMNSYAALIKIPTTAPENGGDKVLYMGTERASNNGDAYAGFWLFKDPTVSCTGTNTFTGHHSDGDLLIVSNFTNGGGSANINVYAWSGGAGGSLNTTPVVTGGVCGDPTVTQPDNLCAIANAGTIYTPWPNANPAPTSPTPAGYKGQLDKNQFVEAGVDLTQLFKLEGASGCFATFLAETRESQDPSATLADFAGSSFDTCVKPTVTTTATPGGSALQPGTTQHDVATATGSSGTVNGTMTFELCAPSKVTATKGCLQGDGTPVGSAVTLSSGSATSADVSGATTSALGTYCWGAAYDPTGTSSDGVYLATYETNATTECFTVVKNSPTITTTASPTTAAPGTATTVGDTATFANTNALVLPTGSVTFTLYSDATCHTAVAGMSGSGTISTAIGVTSASFSKSWTPTTAGTYQWIASYAGDSNNNGFTTTCGDANEQIVVGKASPSITTVASPSSGTAGVAINPVSDTATFSNTGAAAPTGVVTFTLYSDSLCTTPVTGITGDGTISTTSNVTTATFSKDWTPTVATTYYWIASYAGDANNNPYTTHCGDSNEHITVGKASPTISTVASPATGTSGVAITSVGDTATFSSTGAAAPTGSVTFTLYSDSLCHTAVTGVSGSGAISTTGGVSTATYSTAWAPPAAGTYYWIASYAGDGTNSAFTTKCGDANEELVISPASPTITTNASPSTGTSGVTIGALSDTATFHGTTTVAPTGSVTFSLYSDGSCLTPVTGVSGSGSISTTGGVSTATYSTSWTPPAAGTYYWIASYAGDANNSVFTTKCGDSNEQIAIGKASPTITTQASPTTGTSGVAITSVGDTATFANTTLVPPTGSVTFSFFSEHTCTTAVAGVGGSGTITTTGGTSSASYSTSWTPPAAGTYYWKASYLGDANNNGFTTGCGDANEQLVISPASPTITTSASPSTGTSGVAITGLSDTATFHGTTTVAPTGSVDFALYSDSNCLNAVTGVSGSGAISTSGGVSTANYSTTWTPPAAGTYYWIASYAGDPNNNAFTTKCGDSNEEITVGKASPNITTQASPTTGTAGTAITAVGDTATFGNTTTVAPTGSVSFALFSDATCLAPVTGVSGSGTISTTGGTSTATFSTSWTPTAAGTYFWIASYGGDANNNGFTTSCGDDNEQIVIAKASPAIATTIQITGTNPNTLGGTTFGDTATVTGFVPSVVGETVNFSLFGPYQNGVTPTCATATGEPVFTTTGTLDANGVATTSATYTPIAGGTFTWVATWAGDANNNGATEPCNMPTETSQVIAGGAQGVTTPIPVPPTGVSANWRAALELMLLGMALFGAALVRRRRYTA